LEEMPMLEETLLDWWNGAREDGWVKGREEGRAKGREEGQLEGQLRGKQQMLLRLLEKRFGRLPRKALRKIEALHADNQLDSLFDRALTADSLSELGLG
jgi:predicted transposase YdaD